MRTFSNVRELQEAAGQELGSSGWLLVDQARVDQFAGATDDHQWIHVDPERAASGPFGTTIAHGYLTLSLLPRLAAEIFSVTGVTAAINYGMNRVRFVQPVPVGAWVRSTATLDSVTPVPGGAQLVVSHRVDLRTQAPSGAGGGSSDGGEDIAAKPACIAETISRVLF